MESGNVSQQQRLSSARSRKSQMSKHDEINEDVEEQQAEEKKPSRVAAICKKGLKFAFSTVGLGILVVVVTIAGGFIFKHLEEHNEKTECENANADYLKAENATVELLWDINLQTDLDDQAKKDRYVEKLRSFSLSVLDTGYNVTKDCSMMGKEGGQAYKWSLAGSILFALTVISTIGYGHIAPKTLWGKIVCIAYAVIGIPIFLLCLANIGDPLADMFRFVYSNACCCGCCRKKEKRPASGQVSPEPQTAWKTDESGMPIPASKPSDDDDEEDEEEDDDEITVPLTITMMVLLLFIFLGSVLFSETDGLDFLDATYFSFITLSTIGFGDFVPGTDVENAGSVLAMMFSILYLLVGMALLSMCFTLMQDEVVAKFKWIGEKVGLIKKDEEEDDDEEDEDNHEEQAKTGGTESRASRKAAEADVVSHK